MNPLLTILNLVLGAVLEISESQTLLILMQSSLLERGRYGGTYTHYPSPLGASFIVNALSADVLVIFKMTPSDELRKSPSEQGMVRYELNVIDQRDGETHAHLQYVIDAKKNRACGETGKNRMDEREFVLKAIGLGAQ